jgi:hypothetical protein
MGILGLSGEFERAKWMDQLSSFITPHVFLLLVGPLLVVLGSMGLAGRLATISNASFFHPPYWINWVHLNVGLSAIGVGFFAGAKLQAAMVLAPAAIGMTIGPIGLLFGRWAAARFTIPQIADPSDHAAHLLVGLAATAAWLNG